MFPMSRSPWLLRHDLVKVVVDGLILMSNKLIDIHRLFKLVSGLSESRVEMLWV